MVFRELLISAGSENLAEEAALPLVVSDASPHRTVAPLLDLGSLACASGRARRL